MRLLALLRLDKPPSERAARMTQRLLRLRIDWRRVRNIASEARGDG